MRCPCRPLLRRPSPGSGGEAGAPHPPRRACLRGPGRGMQRGPPAHGDFHCTWEGWFCPSMSRRLRTASPLGQGQRSSGQLRFKTFIDEIWARKMLCKKSQSSDFPSLPCGTWRDQGCVRAMRREGKGVSRKDETGKNAAGKSITKCISSSRV